VGRIIVYIALLLVWNIALMCAFGVLVWIYVYTFILVYGLPCLLKHWLILFIF